MVVLALTGFSSSHGHGSRGQHGSDGGGCSSSQQDHDGSTPSSGGAAPHDSATRPGSGGHATRPSTPAPSPSGATARPQKDGTAVLVHCATVGAPYATVEVSNPNARDSLFTVKITFKDRYGNTIIKTSDQTFVSARDKAPSVQPSPAREAWTTSIAVRSTPRPPSTGSSRPGPTARVFASRPPAAVLLRCSDRVRRGDGCVT
ncbi:hypothetical protein [Streptomyces sp. NPDC001507]|uniref:hypothetical protein n=1 Tax=Streptomyces sp. NPDC001507 TaxID=3364579 RepID=UPI00367DDFD7